MAVKKIIIGNNNYLNYCQRIIVSDNNYLGATIIIWIIVSELLSANYGTQQYISNYGNIWIYCQ